MRRRPVRSLRIQTLPALLIGCFAALFLSLSAHSETLTELAAAARASHPQTVLLDAWFNSQQRRSTTGQMEYYHYKWDDTSDSGFSMLGQVFRDDGVATKTLFTAPTRRNLAGAQYYILVSPDNVAKKPHAHFMTDASARQVSAWVRAGGVLLLLDNDPSNADIVHMDKLADIFGLHFNDVLVHHVVGRDLEMGRIDVQGGGAVFHHPHTLFMKDTCSLSLSGRASAVVQDQGTILMATAKYGRGTVFAVTDPWLYNEYTNGKNLPANYDNLAAGKELVRWLIGQHAGAAN
jgi:unsaturated rhamnogalacturonyl hydrolase